MIKDLYKKYITAAPNFQYSEYDKVVKEMERNISDASDALSRLKFEYGRGGISGRAVSYCEDIKESLQNAEKSRKAVAKMIKKYCPDSSFASIAAKYKVKADYKAYHTVTVEFYQDGGTAFQ